MLPQLVPDLDKKKKEKKKEFYIFVGTQWVPVEHHVKRLVILYVVDQKRERKKH